MNIITTDLCMIFYQFTYTCNYSNIIIVFYHCYARSVSFFQKKTHFYLHLPLIKTIKNRILVCTVNLFLSFIRLYTLTMSLHAYLPLTSFHQTNSHNDYCTVQCLYLNAPIVCFTERFSPHFLTSVTQTLK